MQNSSTKYEHLCIYIPIIFRRAGQSGKSVLVPDAFLIITCLLVRNISRILLSYDIYIYIHKYDEHIVTYIVYIYIYMIYMCTYIPRYCNV